MRPLLKWVGGKRQLLHEIRTRIPENINVYHEPFFGGGAVLFDLQPRTARINDLNSELINVYNIVRDNPEELIKLLHSHAINNCSEYFYQIRSMDRDDHTYRNLTPIQRAARIMYLNKTCYNGLYRVNRQGQLNAPFGRYVNPKICDEENIWEVHNYFQDAIIEICNFDYEFFLEHVQPGDFVYLDPPYHPISVTSNFTGYQAGGFGKEEQIRLRNVCDRIHEIGAYFMLSNSYTDFILEIYNRPEYHISEVLAKRTINSNANRRGEILEVIITNY